VSETFRFTPEERAQLARLLVDSGAFQVGDFTLASGVRSPYYIDAKRAITRPDVLALAAAAMAPHIDCDRIAAVELAGIPLAAAVSLAVDKPFVMVRKAAKAHGTKKRYEGDVRQGETITFVEDVTTTGGSVLDGITVLEEAGAQVLTVVSLVDRGEGAEEALFKRGVELVPILDVAALRRAQEEIGALSRGKRRP
jgi:orotate phosphoribosyltransferase